MQGAIELVGLGVLVPAAVSIAMFLLARRLLKDEISQRYAAAVAFAAAYCVGHVLALSSWAELTPTRHWHWIPYLTLAAAVIGPAALAGGVHWTERLLLHGIAAFVSAWLLTPIWPNLKPPRAVCIPLLAGYLFLLTALLEPLLKRLPPRNVLGLLALIAACVAALIGALVSVTYAQVAGVAMAALAGCWIAACFWKKAATARGLGLTYAVTVGGWAFVGCIDPQEPLIALMFAPLTPLALWCCVVGPLARLRGVKALAVQIAMVLFVLVIIAGAGVWTSP